MLIGDPKHPNYFCEKHGPEKALIMSGVPYVKAKPGDKCRQISNWTAAFSEVLMVLFETGSIPKMVDKFKEIYRG